MTNPLPVDELGYPEALAELEAILERLEHDEPDVDRVAADVSRAGELIVHCRGRITAARLKVDEVVGTLAAPSAAAPTSAAGAEVDLGAGDEGDAG